MGSYYLLGYYSTNNAADGKYRKISVKLNNPKLAAKLEHREGYYADKVWGKLNAQDKEQQLKEALSAGDPVTDLPLALQIDYFRVSPTAYFVPVSIKIPGRWWRWRRRAARAPRSSISRARFRTSGTRWWAMCATRSDQAECRHGGHRRSPGPQPAAPRLPRPSPRAGHHGRKSFQYDAGFTLEPGKYRMKFVVRENITGKMGTFETRFTVPDLSADTSRPETQHGDLEQPARAGQGGGGSGASVSRGKKCAPIR